MTDEERQAIYRAALERAKGDFDAMSAELTKVQGIVTALRKIIYGASELLGEPIDDKYEWPSLSDRERGRADARKRSHVAGS